MSETEPRIPPQDASQDVPSSALSNAERLRAHLLKDKLAMALLTAWEAGDAVKAPSRMLAALDAFHVPK